MFLRIAEIKKSRSVGQVVLLNTALRIHINAENACGLGALAVSLFIIKMDRTMKQVRAYAQRYLRKVLEQILECFLF